MKGQEKSLSSSESSDSGICLPNKKENINAADHPRSKPRSEPNQDRERVKRKVVTITHRPPKAISVTQRPQKAIRVAPQTTPLKKQTTPAKTIPHPQKNSTENSSENANNSSASTSASGVCKDFSKGKLCGKLG